MLSNKWIQSTTCVGSGVRFAVVKPVYGQTRSSAETIAKPRDASSSLWCLQLQSHIHTRALSLHNMYRYKAYICARQYVEKVTRTILTKTFHGNQKFRNPEYCYLRKYFHWKFIEVQEICIDNRTVCRYLLCLNYTYCIIVLGILIYYRIINILLESD